MDTMHPSVPPLSPEEALAELEEESRLLATLDPAEAVDPAASLTDRLGRLLEEEADHGGGSL
ncbi:MAG: hypothetical protein ACRDVM_01595 [Acidimicrobiia bacterium]